MKTALRFYYHGLTLYVGFTPASPGVRTFRNGDPGYPPEGCEVEIDRIEIDDADEWREWVDPDEPVSVGEGAIRKYLEDNYDELCEAAKEEYARD